MATFALIARRRPTGGTTPATRFVAFYHDVPRPLADQGREAIRLTWSNPSHLSRTDACDPRPLDLKRA